MRWLALIAVLSATAIGTWHLTRGGSSPALGRGDWPSWPRQRSLWFWLAAAVYAAHLLGIFSIPLVAWHSYLSAPVRALGLARVTILPTPRTQPYGNSRSSS